MSLSVSLNANNLFATKNNWMILSRNSFGELERSAMDIHFL